MLTALLLVPLLGFAGFAVDVGSWYSRASELSRTADAASLAGVVWLPDEAAATSVAMETVLRNGIDPSDPNIDVVVTKLDAARLSVEIRDNDIPLYFSGLFLDDVTIDREAVAEYIDQVPMGSPENFVGNDPMDPSLTQPNLWLATFGTNTNKTSGDRYHTIPCGGVYCTGGTNDEYDERGYFFKVEVDSVGGPLGIELFDPVHHEYEDNCRAGQGNDWLFVDGAVAAEPWYVSPGLGDFPEERYENGDNAGGAAWCPGDNGLGGNFEMTAIVRGPDSTPFDPNDNPVVCWARFGNEEPADRADFVARLQDPVGNQPVASAGAGAVAQDSLAFDDYFRNWVRVCTIASPTVGDYFVQIRTNANTSGSPWITDPAISTTGRNRYSLRAGFGAAGSPMSATGVSLTANGRLPMFVNRPGGDGIPTSFYLARVQPQYAGQRLQLDLYDLTDGSDLSVAFLPPADSGLPAFTNCTMTMETSGGSSPLNSSNCAATHLSEPRLKSGQSNGNSIVAEIVIPAGYTCNDTDPFGCWITAQMVFDGTPSDTTTWSAQLSGDPIRLID